jgi:uncharacterized protein (TIGR03067 family)
MKVKGCYRFIVALAFGVAFFSSVLAQEIPSLDGTWKVTQSEINGKPQQAWIVNSSGITFGAGTFVSTVAGKDDRGIVTLHPDQQGGGTIDLVFKEGAAAGRTIEGVYLLKDGELYMSVDFRPGMRPSTAFGGPDCQCSAMRLHKTVGAAVVTPLFWVSFSLGVTVGLCILPAAILGASYLLNVIRKRSGVPAISILISTILATLPGFFLCWRAFIDSSAKPGSQYVYLIVSLALLVLGALWYAGARRRGIGVQ